jgi:phospholipid/cholesterol/gamma-HCH transport system substrate-binding protein
VRTRTVEIVVGAFVAVGLAALFFLAMQVSNLGSFSGDDGYELTARFENVGGLKVRSPVAIGGVKIGSVSNIVFDIETFEAVATLYIEPQYGSLEVVDVTDENPKGREIVVSKLPEGTSASIYTAGLLGEQYVSLTAGSEDTYMYAGDELSLTEDAIVLEEVIGRLVFSLTGDGDDEGAEDEGEEYDEEEDEGDEGDEGDEESDDAAEDEESTNNGDQVEDEEDAE